MPRKFQKRSDLLGIKKHWPNNREARYRAANAFIDHKKESVRDIPPCQIETLELEERGLFLTARIITVTESCGMHYYVRGVKFGAATVAVPFQLCSVSRYHDCPSAWISYRHQSIGKRNRNGETSRWNRCMCTRATRWSNGLVASVCRSRRKSSIGRPAITGASREITFSIFLSPRLEPLRRFLPTNPPLLFHRSMCFNCYCSFFLLSSFLPFAVLFLCFTWRWKDTCCEWKTRWRMCVKLYCPILLDQFSESLLSSISVFIFVQRFGISFSFYNLMRHLNDSILGK